MGSLESVRLGNNYTFAPFWASRQTPSLDAPQTLHGTDDGIAIAANALSPPMLPVFGAFSNPSLLFFSREAQNDCVRGLQAPGTAIEMISVAFGMCYADLSLLEAKGHVCEFGFSPRETIID